MNPILVQLIDRGDRGAVQRLLDSALPPVSVLNEALREAIRAGKHELIGLLVSRGADIGVLPASVYDSRWAGSLSSVSNGTTTEDI